MAKLPDGWVFIPRMKDAITIELEQRELVTCRHCKHRDPESGCCDCGGHEMMKGKILAMPDNWWCADGER